MAVDFDPGDWVLGPNGRPQIPVHYYLEIYACKRIDEKNKFTVDDGFWTGGTTHSGPFITGDDLYKPYIPLWPFPGYKPPFIPAPR
jgi:hypothetical protein